MWLYILGGASFVAVVVSGAYLWLYLEGPCCRH